MIALALFLIALALILVVRSGSCRHTDEDGRSLLSWSYDDRSQRLRGFCWNCYRFTAGWPMGETPAVMTYERVDRESKELRSREGHPTESYGTGASDEEPMAIFPDVHGGVA